MWEEPSRSEQKCLIVSTTRGRFRTPAIKSRQIVASTYRKLSLKPGFSPQKATIEKNNICLDSQLMNLDYYFGGKTTLRICRCIYIYILNLTIYIYIYIYLYIYISIYIYILYRFILNLYLLKIKPYLYKS